MLPRTSTRPVNITAAWTERRLSKSRQPLRSLSVAGGTCSEYRVHAPSSRVRAGSIDECGSNAAREVRRCRLVRCFCELRRRCRREEAARAPRASRAPVDRGAAREGWACLVVALWSAAQRAMRSRMPTCGDGGAGSAWALLPPSSERHAMQRAQYTERARPIEADRSGERLEQRALELVLRPVATRVS